MKQLIVYLTAHYYPLKRKLRSLGFGNVKFLDSFEILKFDPTISYTVIALLNFYPKTCKNKNCLDDYNRTTTNFLTTLTQTYLTEEVYVLLPEPIWRLKNLELQRSISSQLRQFCSNRGIGVILAPEAASKSSIHLPKFQLRHRKINQLTDSIWNQVKSRA